MQWTPLLKPFCERHTCRNSVSLKSNNQLSICFQKVLRPFLLRRLKKEVESQLPEKVCSCKWHQQKNKKTKKKKKEKRFETSFVWWSSIKHKRTGKTSYLFILAFTLPEMTEKEFHFTDLIHCLMQKLDEQKWKYQQRIFVWFICSINSQAKMTRKL